MGAIGRLRAVAHGVDQAHQTAGHADLVVVPMLAVALMGRAEGVLPGDDGLVGVAGVGDQALQNAAVDCAPSVVPA